VVIGLEHALFHDQHVVGQRDRVQHHVGDAGAGVEQDAVEARRHLLDHVEQLLALLPADVEQLHPSQPTVLEDADARLKQPLGEELLFGKLEKGGKVTIDIEDTEIVDEATGEKKPGKGSEIDPEIVCLQAVEEQWPQGKARRRASCMSRRVTLGSKVKSFGRSRSESESE